MQWHQSESEREAKEEKTWRKGTFYKLTVEDTLRQTDCKERTRARGSRQKCISEPRSPVGVWGQSTPTHYRHTKFAAHKRISQVGLIPKQYCALLVPPPKKTSQRQSQDPGSGRGDTWSPLPPISAKLPSRHLATTVRSIRDIWPQTRTHARTPDPERQTKRHKGIMHYARIEKNNFFLQNIHSAKALSMFLEHGSNLHACRLPLHTQSLAGSWEISQWRI